jgi:hypothetical protein
VACAAAAGADVLSRVLLCSAMLLSCYHHLILHTSTMHTVYTYPIHPVLLIIRKLTNSKKAKCHCTRGQRLWQRTNNKQATQTSLLKSLIRPAWAFNPNKAFQVGRPTPHQELCLSFLALLGSLFWNKSSQCDSHTA